MYTLILVVYSTVFAIGPDVDGHPTRNLSVPPTVSQSVIRAGTFASLTACDKVSDLIHNRRTAYADIETEASCVELPTVQEQAATLDR